MRRPLAGHLRAPFLTCPLTVVPHRRRRRGQAPDPQMPKSGKKYVNPHYSNILLQLRTRDPPNRSFLPTTRPKTAQKRPGHARTRDPPKSQFPPYDTQKTAPGHARTRDPPKSQFPPYDTPKTGARTRPDTRHSNSYVWETFLVTFRQKGL